MSSVAATQAIAVRDAPRAASFDGTIAGWLLHSPVQLTSGPHAGAVAGGLDAAGDAPYVYPEIAGYYLQWLAWRAQRFGDASALAGRAAAVQRWLAVWLAAGDPPPTRVHLDGATGDWRNDAMFFFDIAMVLRGLGTAAHAKLIVADPSVVAGVVHQLERLVAADGEYDACWMKPGKGLLAARWSTRRGAFLTKAAAGVLTGARTLPGVPQHLADAAEITLASSLASLASAPHRETHPLLYAFEGVLAQPLHRRFRDVLPSLAEQFDDLLARVDADGYLPETIGGTEDGPLRIDVVAQALRVGHLLAAHRPHGSWDRRALQRLAQALTRELRTTGGVPFARNRDRTRCNAWVAMFADQALAFARPLLRADELRRDATLLV